MRFALFVATMRFALFVATISTFISPALPFSLSPADKNTARNGSHLLWSVTASTQDAGVTISARDKIAERLLVAVAEAGQVGSKATEAQIDSVKALADELTSYSERNPSRVPLVGVHSLLYSMSPGGSSGALGPFIGRVTQTFPDDKRFINAVRLGPLQIKLHAEREEIDGQRIRVKFLETSVEIFGAEVVRKETKGAGIWKNTFVGYIRGKDNSEKLLRVMETPSLFIIEQPME